MKQFLSLLFFITTFQSYCQIKYIPGLIVTQNDDTITCLVPATSFFKDKITIKKSEGGDEEKIPLNQIKYLANGLSVFENVSFEKEGREIHKLMWLKLEGTINLYLETVFNSGSFPTKTYAIRKADTTLLIEEDNFIETITPLISDNKELVRKVAVKFYRYEDVETLVKQYDGLPEPLNTLSGMNTSVPSQVFSDKANRKIVETECEGKIFTRVETPPSITGGESALADSLSVYLSNGNSSVKGKATYVFVVTKNSKLLGIEKLSGEISKENDFKKGLLAYSNMWIPALQNSRNVCAVVQLDTEFEKEQITLRIISNVPK
jgi:hypothetical protein